MKNGIKKEKKKLSKVLIGAGLLACSSVAAMAEGFTDENGDAGFGKLFGLFHTWLTGNLGKLLALLGFAGTFIVYMMTHKASVLFVGLIIAVVAGGLSGLTSLFFDSGLTAFDSLQFNGTVGE